MKRPASRKLTALVLREDSRFHLYHPGGLPVQVGMRSFDGELVVRTSDVGSVYLLRIPRAEPRRIHHFSNDRVVITEAEARKFGWQPPAGQQAVR
jgi:hypothetical protein